MHVRIVVGALAMGLVAAPATAQDRAVESVRGWTVGVGGFAVAWTERAAAFDVAGGGAVHVALVRPGGIGVEVRGGYFFPTGFYDLNGLSGIFGLTYSLPVGASLVQLKAGVTGLVGGDSDGSIIGGGGPYGGAGAIVRLTGRLALQGDLLARVYETGSGVVFGPSLAVGVAVVPE